MEVEVARQLFLLKDFAENNPKPFERWKDFNVPSTIEFVAKLSCLPTVVNGMRKVGMEHLYEWMDLDRRSVIKSLAMEAGYISNNQLPSLLFIPGLSSNPEVFYDINKFSWTKILMENRDQIIAELPLKRGCQLQPGWQESIYEGRTFTNTGTWLSYYFFHGGNPVPENQKRCPTLMKVFESIPINWLGTSSLSALTPKTSIRPHFGEINFELRCQLPLLGFSDAQITVGGIEKQYTEEPVIFDDTFFHSVKNQGDETRVVLLFDFFHPDFAPAEVSLLQEALKVLNTQYITGYAKEQAATLSIQPVNWLVIK